MLEPRVRFRKSVKLEKSLLLTKAPQAMTNLTSASELYLLVVTHIKCVAVNWGLATGKQRDCQIETLAKKYTRNDKNNEPRHCFISQDLESAVGNSYFACLVGNTDGDEDTQAMETMDYA